MKTVFRIENEKGLGPYQGTDLSWCTKNHNTSIKTPTPPDDLKLEKNADKVKNFNPYSYVFGFKNLKQLKNWFSKRELFNLKKLGFNVVKYKASEVIEGDKQIAFKKAA